MDIRNKFNELEKKSVEKGLFVDCEAVCAQPGYSAVQCTVSDREGKRYVRFGEGTDIMMAQMYAVVMALQAYEHIDDPDVYKTAVKKPEDRNQRNAATAQNDRRPAAQPDRRPAAAVPENTGNRGQAANRKMTPAPEPTRENENAAAQPAAPKAPAAPAATEAPAPETTASNVPASDDDFRVEVGVYSKSPKNEANYISQLLQDPSGRNFLHRLLTIPNPTENVKQYIDKTKAYLQAHNLTV